MKKNERGRMRGQGAPVASLVLLALVGTLVPLASAAPSGAASITHSASRLLAQSKGAAQKSGSMRFTDRSTSGKETESLSGAISAKAAGESLTATGSDPLEVLLVGHTIYLQASAQILQSALDLPAEAAAAESGKWISMQSGDSAFATLADELTVTSELNTYVPASHLKVGKEIKVAGHKVIPITGQPSAAAANGATSGSAALLVSPKSPYLPVGGTLILSKTGSSELKEVAIFGEWGKSVSLSAPTGAVSFDSLAG